MLVLHNFGGVIFGFVSGNEVFTYLVEHMFLDIYAVVFCSAGRV